MSIIVRQQLQKDIRRLALKSNRFHNEKVKAQAEVKKVSEKKKGLDLEIAELTLHLDNLGGPVTKEELENE